MLILYEEKLKRSIELNGETKKKVIAMEECSELIQAVSKDIRGEYDHENMLEEMADVYICLEMLKIMNKITDRDIQGYVEYKIARLVNRDVKKYGRDKVMA